MLSLRRARAQLGINVFGACARINSGTCPVRSLCDRVLTLKSIIEIKSQLNSRVTLLFLSAALIAQGQYPKIQAAVYRIIQTWLVRAIRVTKTHRSTTDRSLGTLFRVANCTRKTRDRRNADTRFDRSRARRCSNRPTWITYAFLPTFARTTHAPIQKYTVARMQLVSLSHDVFHEKFLGNFPRERIVRSPRGNRIDRLRSEIFGEIGGNSIAILTSSECFLCFHSMHSLNHIRWRRKDVWYYCDRTEK